MRVELIDHMGNDLSVVNAARVSFDKWHSHITDGDVKLINYLAKHEHWTPFAHPQATLRITAPVFVRTQCFKHKIGFVENEVSRRYVDAPPSFYSPGTWRGRSEDKKQGSSDKDIRGIPVDINPGSGLSDVCTSYWQLIDAAKDLYERMIAGGVTPEQARMVLPQSMNTSWIWTGSLLAYTRFYNQRSKGDAQREIQLLANMVRLKLQPLFPISWEALCTT